MKSKLSFALIAFVSVMSAYLVYATNVGAILGAPLTPPVTPPITAPVVISINITSPNGFETLSVGQSYPIRWVSTPNIDKVSIGYSTQNGTLAWIANNIPNNNMYIWNVNIGTGSTQAKIYIIGYQTGYSSTSDYSDNYFLVKPVPTITPTIRPTNTPTATPTPTRFVKLITPNGGEIFTVGQPVRINWQSSGISRVAIDISTDPQGYNTYGVVYNIGNSNSYTWMANNFKLPSTTKFYVRIRGFYDAANNSVIDFTDSSFTIKNSLPTITPTKKPSPTPTPRKVCSVCKGRICIMRVCPINY